MSLEPTDPSSLFGGNWEQIQGCFLLATSDEYEAGSIGGEATHKLIVSEMPSHSHAISGVSPTSRTSGAIGNSYCLPYSDTITVSTNATGGSTAHNNMPPYLAVYMWKRIA